MIKQGRTVDFMEEKMAVIQEYAQKTEIPVIEIPFEMPFREILNTIMEHVLVRKLSDLSILRQLMIISRHCHFPFIPWKMECSVL